MFARPGLSKAFLPTINHCYVRPYSISRFPKRVTGAGRKRPRLQSRGTTENSARVNEEDTSLTWSPKPPPIHSHGDTGLSKMLMHRDTLVIERQLEMLNVFIGFEQSNKYSISDVDGEPLGYIAEEPRGLLGTLSRQVFSTHRPFRAVIMDKEGLPVRRPFAWINSRMFVQRLKDHSHSPYDPNPVLETFGEVHQIWHLWRRRYDMFLRETLSKAQELDVVVPQNDHSTQSTYYQIGQVDSGFLAWDFSVLNEQGVEIARIERAFRGIGREIFTDTGRYSVHFKATGAPVSSSHVPELSNRDISQSTFNELNIDARALLLSLAVNIDFDYFSRHSQAGGGGIFHMSTWE